MVAYVSMAFGNPYDDPWSLEEVVAACHSLEDLGVAQISLADTVGIAEPEQVHSLITAVTTALPGIEVGAHLHARRDQAAAKLRAANTAYGFVNDLAALRHHLVERMLSEVFGMEWYEIHEEAERLEHAVSPAFEAKLKEKLGDGACPHGNAVLPENPEERKRRGEAPLSEAEAGKKYVVVSLQERDPQLLLFLHDAGIGPGKRLKVKSQNYDQTVSIELDKEGKILGRPAAEAVWLREDGVR